MGAVIVAATTVPRPPDDQLWNWWKFQSISVGTPYLPVGGGYPFKPHFWQSNFDYAAEWRGGGVDIPPVERLVGGGFPFVPTFWKQNLDDAGSWQVKPFGPSLVLDLASNLSPAKARFWPNNTDDPGVWQNKPFGPNLMLELASNLPQAKAKFWPNNTDDPGVWTGSPVGPTRGLLSLQPSTPFAASRWKLDYNDSSVWTGKPSNIAAVDMPPSPAISMAALYRPNPPSDDVTGRTAGVANLLLNASVAAPLVPSRWKLDYDDPAVWYTKPGKVPYVTLPVAAPAIITMAAGYTPRPYEFPEWSGTPASSNWILSTTLQLYAPNGESDITPPDEAIWRRGVRPVNNSLLNAGPFIPPLTPSFWKFNHDQPGAWSGAPVNVSIIYQLVIATPLVPQRWRQDNDDPSVWTGKPANLPVTITNPLPPVVPPADDGVRGTETVLRPGGRPVEYVLTRKRWRELLAELEQEGAAPSRAKKAVASVKAAKAAVLDAIDERVVPDAMGKQLARLVVSAESARRATEAIERARQVREEISALYDEDEMIAVLLLS